MNSVKQKQQIEEGSKQMWAQTREMGKLTYILKYWVLWWGIGYAVVFTLYECISNTWDDWLLHLIIGIVIFPICGFVVGLVNWNENERKYLGRISK